MIRVAPIVEGHGDSTSVRNLLVRIAAAADVHDLEVARPIRVPRNKIVKPDEFERAIDLASRQVAGSGGILVLLDADDDKGCEVGPQLVERAGNARSDVPCYVTLATVEYENWFIASIESLRGKRGISWQAAVPHDPESVRGAKEWMASQMDRPYSEVTDQPALTALFDLEVARARSRSFDKLYRDVSDLLSRLRSGSGAP
jgi:uncharacterized protein DUF4276